MKLIELIKITLLRKKFHNILIVGSLSLIFFISISIMLLLTTFNNTKEIISIQIPTVATTQLERRDKFNFLDLETLRKIGELPEVKSSDFLLTVHFYHLYLQWVDSMSPSNFTIRGVYNSNITDIEAGLISIRYGRTFKQEEIDQRELVMIVSNSIAKRNNLEIGSFFTITNMAHNYLWHGNWSDRFNDEFIIAKEYINFEIIGIYDSGENEFLEYHSINYFYIPFTVAEDMLHFRYEAMKNYDEESFKNLGQGIFSETLFLESLFLLESNSISIINSFQDAASNILPANWSINILQESSFTNLFFAFEETNNLFFNFLIYTYSLGTFLITLIVMLIIHLRSRELFIYKILGRKKIDIFNQLSNELVVLGFISYLLSIIFLIPMKSLVKNLILIPNLINMSVIFDHNSRIPLELSLFIPRSFNSDDIINLLDISFNIFEINLIFFGYVILIKIILGIFIMSKKVKCWTRSYSN